jgi:hypothetical protein
MHGACGVIDTSCTVHAVSCGIIDTACTEHAVSLIPHAQKIFRTTSKSENHMQNSDGVHKKLKMHGVSMTLHARSTNDSNGPGSL